MHPKLTLRRLPRGFTLIELLTVTAIVTLLAALLLPTLTRATEQARTTVCLSHVQQIARAHLLYLQDWDERLPDWWQPGPARPEPFRDRRYWTEYLQPHLGSGAILRDPSARSASDSLRGFRLADYALLTWGPDGTGGADRPYWRHPGPPLSLAEVPRPAETMSVTDGVTTTELTRAHIARHHGGTVAGFLDGHARWLPTALAFEVRYDPRGPYQSNYFFRYAAADR